MKILVQAIITCILTISVCLQAHAETNVHDGFFLRVAPGFGWSSTSSQFGDAAQELSDSGGMMNLAIGTAVARNFILHLNVSGVSISTPKERINGQQQPSTVNYTASSMAGIGITYYLPSNYYLSGAVGMAESSIKSSGIIHATDTGYGVNVMAGKEWWVSSEWGFGLAGQFLYTNCPDKPVTGGAHDVKTTAYGLLFSATYN